MPDHHHSLEIRGRTAACHAHPHRLDGFRDAVGLALELADRHPSANAAALAGPCGAIADLTVFSDEVLHTPATALDRAFQVVTAPPPDLSLRPTQLVLFTVSLDPPRFSEADRALLRWATDTFAAFGVIVRDWLHTDGVVLRSAAHGTADQPPPRW